MRESDLVDAVADDLFTYVLNGDFPADDIAPLIKPASYPDQYDDFDRLVDLHFILDEAVQDFVTDLEQDLRGIKTGTERESTVQRGGITGRIDWGATYQERATTSPGNSGLYVTELQSEAYDISENIVLKELISRIHSALKNVTRYLTDSRTWVENTWAAGSDLRDSFQTTAEQNIHLRRIPDPKPTEPTDRMLTRAASSRTELYREAATLVQQRQQYDAGDPDAIGALLQDTLITPSGRQTLFELFALFRIIDALRNLDEQAIGRPTYHTLESGREVAATFDGARALEVYYDQTPDDISFHPYTESKGPQSRSDMAHKQAREVADVFLTETAVQQHTKRPDVIVRAGTSDTPYTDYLIVEVKDSTKQDRIRSGITELAEYLQFLRTESGYEFPEGDFGSGLNGLLVVQDLDTTDKITPASLAQQAGADIPIRIVQARHLQTVLPSLLRRIFCLQYS